MKKFLSMILVIAMIVTIFPCTAFAITSGWGYLGWALEGRPISEMGDWYADYFTIVDNNDTRTIFLKQDIVAEEYYDDELLLVVATTTDIVLRLEGHSIKRNFTTPTDAGFVIKVASGSDLTILGESNSNKITGGNNTGNGGGIFVEAGGSLSLYGILNISENKAKNGGAVYAEEGSKFYINGYGYSVKFSNNSAEENGGAIYNGAKDAKIAGTFENNTAQKGGALYIATYTDLDYSTINNCVASCGGAVYVAENGWCEMTGSITSCSALGENSRGGAAYIEHGGTMTFIENASVKDCTAQEFGGAIYSEGVVGLEKCTIKNNSVESTGNGGGVYLASRAGLFLGKIAKVLDNKKGGTPNNVLVCSGASLYFGSGTDVAVPTSGMAIHLSLETVPTGGVPILTIHSNSKDYVKYLSFENVNISDYEVIFEDGELKFCKKEDEPIYYYGGDVTYYDVVTSAGVNGTIDVDKKSASSGSTVTVTVAPDKGFTLETLVVLDKNGKEIEVKDTTEKNKYTFKMPSSKVTVNATFMEDNTMLNYCVDVKKEDYFYDSVLWAYGNEICNGTDELHFSPAKTLTRAEAVTMLWRIAGKPVVNYWMQFKDVESGRYYTEAVRWAASEKIAVGYSDEKFGTTDLITREQLAKMIYGYVQKKGEGFTGSWMFLLPYEDRAKISDWANEAAHWCSMKGVINGKDGNLFDPQGTATRAEAITMLYRFDSLMK